MPAWPGGVPDDPLSQAYDEVLGGGQRLRTPMDAGPAKHRRRFTAGVKPMTCVIPMTKAQLATFETFYETTLAGGTLPFDYTHPRKQTTVSLRFVEDPVPQAEAGGQTYRLPCKFEVLP